MGGEATTRWRRRGWQSQQRKGGASGVGVEAEDVSSIWASVSTEDPEREERAVNWERERKGRESQDERKSARTPMYSMSHSRAKVWDGCEFQREEHRERVNEWDFTAMDSTPLSSFPPQQRARRANLPTNLNPTGLAARTVTLPPSP
ncbi:hypothetical protein B0H14DRAFT_2595883 [Mycena olivaceomarginata]|nr:hypothetical protein B0H14DRAFT_2595883 [Mycena olivaceomarginata]